MTTGHRHHDMGGRPAGAVVAAEHELEPWEQTVEAMMWLLGTVLADDVEVRVHDSTADLRYLVVPLRPKGTEGYDEVSLAALVTLDSMIGVAPAVTPGTSRP